MSPDLPTLADIAAETHAFLSARVPLRPQGGAIGVGNDDVVGVGLDRGESEKATVERAQEWQRELVDAGLAWLEGPAEFGGRGLTSAHVQVFNEVAAGYEVPSTTCFMVSHEIVGPTILAHGSAEQKAKYLPGIWRGDIICCQLFSEPEAGSDLASLRTTAVRSDDGWVVNGQKVWSSFAHHAQLGELLARTGTPESRHRGITAFLLDMAEPGIDVRPLRQLTGNEHFNEVFFEGVKVRDEDRLGEVNKGWGIALTTLGSERSLLSDAYNGIMLQPVARLFGLAESVGAMDDPAIQDLLAECWAREQILRTTGSRAFDSEASAGSVVKLMMTADMEFYVDVASRLLGYRMIADTGAWGNYSWSQLLLGSPAHRIAGGSDEIQKNILAERVLGLPREARPTEKSSADKSSADKSKAE
jgi:alkylation response protein AidB-like acyl-CoA dehydrogenase